MCGVGVEMDESILQYKETKMKYKIDDTVMINNVEWRIAEYRMGRGREYLYTLSYEDTDGSYRTINLNERAINEIIKSGSFKNDQQ